MARKAVERNIAYDDQRKLYYVSMELGRDESGKRLKRYRTFHTLAAAGTASGPSTPGRSGSRRRSRPPLRSWICPTGWSTG